MMVPNRSVASPPKLKKFAKTLRRRQTDPERMLWGLLRDRRFVGFKFRRQVPVGPYVADFLCYDCRLIVELDGSQHGESARDEVRDRWLANDGYRVLRIWNGELVTQRTAVMDAIWYALRSGDQDPSSALRAPSPTRGEGDHLGISVRIPSPLAGEGGSRSETDEGSSRGRRWGRCSTGRRSGWRSWR
jgi:very-short-patch-repair endonuclease